MIFLETLISKHQEAIDEKMNGIGFAFDSVDEFKLTLQ